MKSILLCPLGWLSLFCLLKFSFSSPAVVPTLVLVDSFSSYLSGHCKQYCEENGIQVIECVSPYMQKYLESSGSTVPESLLAPVEGEETSWSHSAGLFEDEEEDDDDAESETSLANQLVEKVAVLSESDAGIATAERISAALGLRGNGRSPHLRNKFLLNERARQCGLKVVKQTLAESVEDVKTFLAAELKWDFTEDSDKERQVHACVIKPHTGVASDGVYKCETLEEVTAAFKKLFRKPKYGGGLNEAVLVQECVSGVEYAVDTVSRDGVIKVVALWKYKKYPLNGAPFVYQCSELVSSAGEEEAQVCDYCVRVLQAEGVNWGPTHTEVMLTKDGPRLIEVNGRWHAQHFKPIVDAALGYDALLSTVDAFFFPDKFDALPDRPDKLRSEGVIMHLISLGKGRIASINHLDEISQLPSYCQHYMDYKEGDELKLTVDIRSDCGYVLLVHADREVLEKDYATIAKLQPTLFQLDADEDGETSSKTDTTVHQVDESFFDRVAQDFRRTKSESSQGPSSTTKKASSNSSDSDDDDDNDDSIETDEVDMKPMSVEKPRASGAVADAEVNTDSEDDDESEDDVTESAQSANSVANQGITSSQSVANEKPIDSSERALTSAESAKPTVVPPAQPSTARPVRWLSRRLGSASSAVKSISSTRPASQTLEDSSLGPVSESPQGLLLMKVLRSGPIKLLLGSAQLMVASYLLMMLGCVYILPMFENYIL